MGSEDKKIDWSEERWKRELVGPRKFLWLPDTVEKLAKMSPQNHYVKLMKAQLVAADGDMDQARVLLEEVVSDEPQNEQARVMLGAVQFALGNLGQAEMHLENVVSRHPDNMRAQRLLAEIRSRLQSPEATLASLKASLDPGTADPAMLVMAGRQEQRLARLTL